MEGYEGKYQISNFGRVKSLDRFLICRNGAVKHYPEIIKKQAIDSKGQYWTVTLSDAEKTPRKKTFDVHVLVAKAFVPNPNGYKFVMHKDQKNLRYDGECNNSADNLEWGTPKMNANQEVCRRRMSNARKKRVTLDSTREKLSKAGKGVAHCQRPVVCEDVIYPNIKQCAEHYNIAPYTMRNWLKKNKISEEWKEKGLRYY